MTDRKDIVKATNPDFIEDQPGLPEQPQISESAELGEAQQGKGAQQIEFRISHPPEDSRVTGRDNEVSNDENDEIVNPNQGENGDRAAGAPTGDEPTGENDETSEEGSDSENDENAAQQLPSSTNTTG